MAAACSGSGNGPTSPAPVAFLTKLVVSGASPVTLVPSFSPDVHDYYVRCTAGANAFTVTMTASTGAESSLLQPTTSPHAAKQTVTISVEEGQAIVALATLAPTTTQYWVRCLPHDFPQLKLVRHPEVGSTTPGYYLVGNATVVAGASGYAMALDGNGVPVWYVRQLAGAGVLDVENDSSEVVSFYAYNDEPETFQLHQLSPLQTTDVAPDGWSLDEHELIQLSNGDYLAFSNQLTGGIDLSGLDIDGVSFGPSSYILACDIVQFDRAGKVSWTWVGTDHLDPVLESVEPSLWGGRAPDGSQVADPFHCNSIDIDASTGNLLVSARDMNAVFYVDRSTGKVLWKLGGTPYSKDNPAYVPVHDPFNAQHDARIQSWSPLGEGGGMGKISMFDDESFSCDQPARAVIYDVTVLPSGHASPPAVVDWQVKGEANASAMGSFRILPDGSRVVGWGISSTRAFTEVDIQGNDLLDFYFSDGNASYRTNKVPLTAFDLNVLRTTAGRQ
jgi:hypothetical protein